MASHGDIDYQLLADQINAAHGTSYETHHIKEIVARLSSSRTAQTLAGGYQSLPSRVFAVTLFADQRATIKWDDVVSYSQPERVYRVNPRMSSVDMLRQAVHDAEN